jgi:hypothetical protein
VLSWVVALVLLVAPLPAASVESLYSRGLYRIIQPAVAKVAGLVPFALFDLVVILACALTLRWFVIAILLPRTNGVRSFARAATLWATLLIVFAMTWGLNFRRLPLTASPEFDASRLTPEAVRDLAVLTVRNLNEIHKTLPKQWPSEIEMRAAMAPLFLSASEDLEGWRPAISQPKATLLHWFMPRTGINGYYLSLLHEIAINPELLPHERPYVLAHEWGHGLGHANESEASYVGWLACDRGPPWARYGAWMRVLDYLTDDLSRDELRVILGPLDEGVRRDYNARIQRARKNVRPAMRRLNVAVTDGAAAVGRVDDSQRDYDLMIQLIIGIGTPKKRASASPAPATPKSTHRVQVPVGAPEVRDTVGNDRR